MQSCVDDVKLWMTQNKLQLNERKTEALLIDPKKSPKLPLSIKISQNDICFSRSVRNLGVIFDDNLSMKQQVNKYVSLPTWNCVELAQLDMSSQLMLTEPL